MKKTYTVTYCEWSSYGSILQALGLQKTIKSLGVENYIIKAHAKPKEKFVLPKAKIRSVYSLAKRTFDYLVFSKTAKRYRENLDFIDKEIDVCYFDSYEELKAEELDADVFVAGSDQIWHPDLCRPLFFLDFVKGKTKRISYAASMGKTLVNEEKVQTFKGLLQNIDSFSVREKDNADVILRYVNKDISVHIDPTFLLSAEQWRLYEKKYPIFEPYILVYAIYWDSKLNKKLKNLSKKTGYKVVSISSSLDKVFAHKKIYDVSVGEFLWLIDNAEYVVTSSFHGVAFSTILEKRFSAVVNEKLPSRISNLMELLDIPYVDIEKLDKDANLFDYQTIDKNISFEKERSIKYLTEEFEVEKQYFEV